jgi:hypothetical protein
MNKGTDEQGTDEQGSDEMILFSVFHSLFLVSWYLILDP